MTDMLGVMGLARGLSDSGSPGGASRGVLIVERGLLSGRSISISIPEISSLEPT